ncbi:hypothetical protein T06_7324, partial [Trichinella sp. T6]
CNENLSFDGVTSGCPGEVSKNIIRKECGSSKSRATRVGVETIGIGLLFECGTFETHFENRGRIMPSRNNISNALSPQLKDREQGKDLRTRLEEGLTSSNIEMEGLINFLINEVLNIKDKERDTYVDGVVNVFTEFLRKPNDHQPRPPPKKRTKEEEKKSRRFEAAAQSVSQSPLYDSDCVSAPCLPPSPTQKIFCPLFRQARLSKGIRHSQRLRMLGLDTDSWALIWKMVTGNTTVIKGDGGSASNKVEWVLKLALQAAGELLHTFQPQKARVNGVCGGSVKVALVTGFSNYSSAKMNKPSINPAQGNLNSAAGATSQGSVSDYRACFTFSYPGPFKCQTCEHVEAVFARIVNHCTHHNVLVNGLTCSICNKHFRIVSAVASHFTHCRKVANSVPAPATVTPLD